MSRRRSSRLLADFGHALAADLNVLLRRVAVYRQLDHGRRPQAGGPSLTARGGALDEVRTAMAARYLEGRIMNARMTAIRRSTKIALRFEAVDDDYRFGEYSDGNGNGVRATDIASGIDPEIAPSELLGSRFSGTAFGLRDHLPEVERGASRSTDGIRLGASRILTLGPDGTASSGTLYVRGRRGQFAVRILGATGRTRVMRFHPGSGQWIVPSASGGVRGVVRARPWRLSARRFARDASSSSST